MDSGSHAPHAAATLRYARGLDGVRGLAVLGVFGYHLGSGRLDGGFIGVDVFFVLSGYLITSLLMAEVERSGTVSLREFYRRRARRLLPALIVLLLAAAVLGVSWLPEQAGRLRGDLIAALGHGTNWWLIYQHASYFGLGDHPALLTHLWSLAVEEQFYIVWPLVILALARRGVGRKVTVAVLLLAIAASALAAGLLYDPWADPSRVYYGTDTRAATPLVGTVLAVLLRPWRPRRPGRHGWDWLGLTGLTGLGIVAWRLTDHDPLLYRGGFLCIAILAAAVVAGAGQPDGWCGRVLGAQPLRWLGSRSYAFYLWHWPVCVLTRPGLDTDLTGPANTALRLAVTLALAEASYRLVERPIRTGALFRLRGRPGPRYATASVLVLVLLAGATAGWRLTAAADAQRRAMPRKAADAPPRAAAPFVAGPPASGVPPRTTPVRVGIFGDSQATALYTYRPPGIRTQLDLSDHSISGCGILRGRVASRSGERFDLVGSCPNWLAAWRDSAKRAKADIALVVVGAWDVFDLRTKDRTLTFGSAEWDANFLATLRTGLTGIRESGAQVVLAELPCYRPRDTNPRPPGWWPERGDDDRTRHVNELLRQAADGLHIFTVHPATAFCDDPAVGDNHKMRFDGVHYLGPGATVYFDAIVPQLLAVPA